MQEFKIMSGLKNVDKLSCIPNCIEVEQNEELPKKENLVIWAGNFDYYIKRPDYMLKIWSLLQNEHKNWRLFMLGDGPSFEDIKEEADQLKLERVEFKGRINPYPYYKMGKIICVTSIFESFSLVTLEGMANYSVPFAFNSFSMASTLIEDGVNGYLVDPFSIQTYANKLGYLMENEDLRNKMSAIACEKSKKYDSKNIYLMWNTLFKNLFV